MTAPASVYEELERVQAKCYALKKQLRTMHAAFDESEAAALRAEKDAYKKALSTVAHLLDRDGEIPVRKLRSIVRAGLEFRDIRPKRRQLVRRVATSLDGPDGQGRRAASGDGSGFMRAEGRPDSVNTTRAADAGHGDA